MEVFLKIKQKHKKGVKIINMLTICGRKCREIYHVFVVLVETRVWFTQTHNISFLLYSKVTAPISSLIITRLLHIILLLLVISLKTKFKENIMQRM